jgi:hypothetical protein
VPVLVYENTLEGIEKYIHRLAGVEAGIKMNANSKDDTLKTAWFSAYKPNGVQVANQLDEVKEFAFASFAMLDRDGDGFIDKYELAAALQDPKLGVREKSFVGFLLRRLDDIKDAYHEEWISGHEGISRVDIQEYFRKIKRLD